MITQAQATHMLSELEHEVQRVGYETADKRGLTSLFGYLKLRCCDWKLYDSQKKLKAVEALERRWQQDRIGAPILGGQGEILGYDPTGTQRGALTIGSILRELRTLLVELPEHIEKPAPQFFLPLVASGVTPASSIPDAVVDAAVSRVLAARDAQQKVVPAGV